MTKAERTRQSHQPRRHFKGKMVSASGGPRAHTHGGGTKSRAGWECGQKQPEITRLVAGRYRVTLPPNMTKFGKGWREAPTR